MKFLVGAQLPRRIVRWIQESGHDAIHTLDLPAGNRTSDEEILKMAAHEERVVVTKDSDFVDTFFITQQPHKLLLISTGNITNAEFEAILLPNIEAIVDAFETSNLVEVSRTALIIHS